jgi:hypothetical protein
MPLSVEPHKVMCSKSVKAIRVARLVAELDLIRVVGENLHNRADLARRKSELRHVCEECYSVEKLNWRSSSHTF